jgi:MFS family permease
MALAYARTLVKARETGLAYGLVETGNATAVILAPLVAGWLYTSNPSSVYMVSLVVLGLVIAINFWTIQQRSKQHFEPVSIDESSEEIITARTQESQIENDRQSENLVS